MSAELACVIEPAGGILGPPGYATSVALTSDRWYLREAFGCSWGGHDNVGRRGEVDWHMVPGYEKVGDGFMTVASLGACFDGFRVVAGWKPDNHGTLVIRNRWNQDHTGVNGKILSEFGGARQLGGVAVAVKNGRYYGFALSGFALTMADITAPTPMQPGQRQPSQAVPGAPGGSGLVASGDTVAYLTQAGELVTYSPGGAPCITSESATCLSPEGGLVLLGIRDGVRIGGDEMALPWTPHAVCLLGGVAYAWVTGADHVQRLYREDEAIFTMPDGIGTVVDVKSWGDRLYCATTGCLVSVRVS